MLNPHGRLIRSRWLALVALLPVLAACSASSPNPATATSAVRPTGLADAFTPTPTTANQAAQVDSQAATATPGPALTPTASIKLHPPQNPEAGDPWQAPSDGMVLKFIPEGTFRMGALPDFERAEPDESPLHEPRISAFWMDETEVTWSMYEDCVEGGPCRPLEAQPPVMGGDYPVVGVTWFEASTYCAWVGRRLPTESEWEKAARGRDARRYPWGWVGAVESNRQIRLNFCDASCELPFHSTEFDDGWAETAPVGSFPAGVSPYGLFDMAGNAWEWTADWYAPEAYQQAAADDPTGPKEGQRRVIRGGAWTEPLFHGSVPGSRTTNRFWNEPDRPRPDLGFRCALSAAGG